VSVSETVYTHRVGLEYLPVQLNAGLQGTFGALLARVLRRCRPFEGHAVGAPRDAST